MNGKWTIKARIGLILALMMFFFSAIILFVIRGVSKTKIENENYQTIVDRQVQFDQALLDIINRVTYQYLYLFDDSSELTDYFENETYTLSEKQDHLLSMLENSDFDQDTFGDAVVYYNQDFYRGKFHDLVVSFPSVATLEIIMNDVRNRLYFIDLLADENNDTYFVFARQITTMYPESETFGVVLFYVKSIVIYDALMMLTSPFSADEGFSLITDELGNVIYSANPTFSAATDFFAGLPSDDFVVKDSESGKVILISTPLNLCYDTYRTFQFQAVSVLDYAVLFEDIDQLNRYIVWIGIVSVLGMVALVGLISQGITRPLDKLIVSLREFSQTKTKKRNMTSDSRDEIFELEKTYDEMIQRIVELIDTNNLEMENKRKLELYALQMQINPHFLYNTLDTIAWMAKLKKEPDIENLVLALARFFRISLHKGDKYIMIEEEFDLVKNFVDIEIARFPNLFTVEYHLDKSIRKVETLKLILQPIVENAIKHGFTGLDRIGHIWISCHQEQEDIIFEVKDDGIGFLPSEALFSEKRLLDGLGGYGLKNVDERVKLEYGREYGIQVVSEKNQGTTVTIRIKKAH